MPNNDSMAYTLCARVFSTLRRKPEVVNHAHPTLVMTGYDLRREPSKRVVMRHYKFEDARKNYFELYMTDRNEPVIVYAQPTANGLAPTDSIRPPISILKVQRFLREITVGRS